MPDIALNPTEAARSHTIEEAAVALAEAIQQTSEWREMREAREVADNDERLAGLMTHYEELSRARQKAQAGGRTWAGQQMVEWITLRDQILNHAVYQRLQAAGSAVVQLLQRTNQAVSEHLGVDFAGTAAPRGGGCCG